MLFQGPAATPMVGAAIAGAELHVVVETEVCCALAAKGIARAPRWFTHITQAFTAHATV